MPTDNEWSDVLTCPLCGCRQVVVVSDPEWRDSYLHGEKLHATHQIPGRGMCQACGAGFTFLTREDQNED